MATPGGPEPDTIRCSINGPCHSCCFTAWCVFLSSSYIVTGDIKGNIKFYDHTLSVVNWYSNFKLGAIRTLSFSKAPASPPTEKSNLPIDCTLKGDLFVVR